MKNLISLFAAIIMMASANAQLIVINDSPVIVEHPVSMTLCAGSSTTLHCAAVSNTGTPTYQWYKDGNLISGAISSTYVVSNASLGANGDYTCKITNGSCSLTTNIATVVVIPLPIANAGPDKTINYGTSVVIGSEPQANVTYAWSVCINTVDWIPSISNPTITPRVTAVYTVIAASEYGCLATDVVRVTVMGSPFIVQPNK